MSVAALLLSGALVCAPAPLQVAVAPVSGAAPQATAFLIDTLRALPGVTVADLAKLDAALGVRQVPVLLACTDDACRREAASGAPWDRLLLTEVGPAGPLDERRVLRLRLIERAGASAVRATVPVGPAQGPEGDVRRPAVPDQAPGIAADLEQALRAGVAELFPERTAQSATAVVIHNLPDGAAVRFDEGDRTLSGTDGRLLERLSPGVHTVEVRAPGHDPWQTRFEVGVGGAVRLTARLSKRRSKLPYFVAGGGLVATGVAIALAVAAQNRRDAWAAACRVDEPCDAGFTRQRFLNDERAIDVESTAANVLFVAGGVAIAGAITWFLLDPGEDGPESVFATQDGVGVRF